MAGIQLSRQHIGHMHDRLQSLQRRVERFKDRAQETTKKFVRTVEVGVGAFGVGVMQGRTGGIELVGVPAELLGGLGLNLAGYFDVAGNYSEHLNNLGDGMLAAYLATVGRGLGAEWQAKAAGSDAAAAAAKQVAAATASKGAQLSPAEVQAIVSEALRQQAGL